MTDTSCREYVRDYCKADLSNEKADLGCVAMTTNTAQLTLVCDFDDVPENSPCNQQECRVNNINNLPKVTFLIPVN